MKVVIVDDSSVMRLGLRTVLDGRGSIEVVGDVGDGDAALEITRRERPDVVLLDVRMPNRDGLSVVKELSQLVKVLMLTFTDDDASIRQAMRDGASGYLVHGTFDASSLGSMVESLSEGAAVLSPGVLESLSGAPSRQAAQPDELPGGLSERQREVMDLIAKGQSNTMIAGQLYLAEKTVKNHINQIFAKLGVQTRAEAIALWLGQSV